MRKVKRVVTKNKGVMDPVVENGIEKLFQSDHSASVDIYIIINLRNKMEAFQKSNAIFH